MKQDKRVGGNLERALQENHSFKPLDVLVEGWQLTKVSFLSLLGAIFLGFLVFLAIAMVLMQVFIGTPDPEDARTVMTLQLTQTLVMPPLFAAIHVMGLRHSVGEKTRPMDVFNFIRQPFPFITVAVISQLLTLLAAGILPPLVALPVMGFILLTLSMALPLVADYKLRPFAAVKSSFIATTRRFGSFLLVYVVMFVLFLLSLLTLGILLIVVAPYFYNVKAVMYREVFGVVAGQDQQGDGPDRGIKSESSHRGSSSNTFDA
ncbi:hypothetical protein [Aliidiomarina soli]|uniref:DUF975 domain-containing protein n=1 Tax=Aliidiomarina soli TaxID=1928574 RepID=A0A432WMC7_9GAMM|nr:hypothetical protein [Aliidiomarina soli]RUO34972.1 hypothetical protein CWE14_02980 [Aliidiomarina soli]